MNWVRRPSVRLAAVALASLLIGCSREAGSTGTARGTEAGHDHAHEGEAGTAQFTVFGEGCEIFVEHPLAVAGAPSPWVIHVTDLRTRGPRREGPLQLRLRLGPEPPLEHVVKAPTRPGVYEAKLSFPRPGQWSVTLAMPTAEGETTIEFPGVEVFADAHEAAHAEVPTPPDGITFLKEQQWKIQVGTAPAQERRLVEQMRLPATVTARPGSLARITPPLPGQLLLRPGKPMPLVGERVELGQVLALLQPAFSEVAARFVEAEGEVVRARLALEQADLAFQRIERLARAEAKSGREVQEAEFALKTAQAKYDAARALQATYRQASTNRGSQSPAGGPPAIELRSPIGGTIIHQSGAAVGQYVTAEEALFTVLDSATVFIEAPVSETSLRRIGAAKGAKYQLPGEPGRFVAITGEGLGRLVFLGLQVDAVTRTVPLVYELGNPDHRLRVGQSLDLYVETDRAENALAIPDAAMVEEGNQPIAFVQVGGERFEKRHLTLGLRDGDWVQVLAGIALGERVVIQGAYAIRLASVSGAIPSHGHAH